MRPAGAPVEIRDNGFEIVDGAEDRHPIDLPTDPRTRIGQHADDAVDRIAVAHRLADEGVGAVFRADQQHRHALGRTALQDMIEPAVLEESVSKPGTAEQRDQHQPVDQQGRARQLFQAREGEHDRQEDQLGQGRRAGDVEQIRQGGVAPDAAVEAGHQEDDGRDGSEHTAIEDHQGRLILQGGVAEPQVNREREGQRRHPDIVQEGEESAAGFR